MSKTATKKKDETVQVAQPAPADKLPTALVLRLPYPKSLGEYADIDQRGWGVLIDAVFPSAQTVEAVCMAVTYCKARNLDIFKKVVHIVPMWSKALNREVETVWPGIPEVRITATRTGVYAGKDAADFGPEIEKEFIHIDTRNDSEVERMTVKFPEWCRYTVYKIVQGQRCAFVGPKVYWEEAYATKSKWSPIPNDMWADRRHGQLDKCAEAASLRSAFPEELGGEYVAEEMHGRTIEAHQVAPGQFSAAVGAAGAEVMVPPKPTRATFEREADETGGKRTTRKKKDAAAPAETTQEETPLARGLRLLAVLKTGKDVEELRMSILEELEEESDKKTWDTACIARQREVTAAK